MPAPVAHETGIGNGTNVASFTLSLTTTQTDYILVLAIYNEHTGTAAATVSSVTSAGMTWALRRRSNSSTTGGLELWWAHGAAALSGYIITVNMAGAYDDACACVVVVSGCNPSTPFDANAGLPARLSAPTATWTPSFTAINTSSANDLLLFLIGTVSGAYTIVASGFSLLVSTGNPGGAWTANNTIAGQTVGALQVNATYTWGGALTNGFGTASCGEAIFDALTGAAPPSTAQARVMVMA